MDVPEQNSMKDASLDPMQTKNQANHVTVTPCAVDLQANFAQLSTLDEDFALA